MNSTFDFDKVKSYHDHAFHSEFVQQKVEQHEIRDVFGSCMAFAFVAQSFEGEKFVDDERGNDKRFLFKGVRVFSLKQSIRKGEQLII